MPRPRIVIALDPERVSSEAIELGHALALATGAPLSLLAVWRWWEPVELAMIAGAVAPRGGRRGPARRRPTGCADRGHDVDERVRAAASIGAALHDAGRREETGLIVLGPRPSRPRGARAGRQHREQLPPRRPVPGRDPAAQVPPVPRVAAADRRRLCGHRRGPRGPSRRRRARAPRCRLVADHLRERHAPPGRVAHPGLRRGRAARRTPRGRRARSSGRDR